MKDSLRKYFAELCGTFILVFCGTGAIIINEYSHGIVTHVGIAMSFGLVVLAMIYTFGDISGCHINPAVTLAFFAGGRFKGREVLPYIMAQILGALLASYALSVLFPMNKMLGTTQPAGPEWQSFVLELIMTFIL